jgi:hypothetical protein
VLKQQIKEEVKEPGLDNEEVSSANRSGSYAPIIPKRELFFKQAQRNRNSDIRGD